MEGCKLALYGHSLRLAPVVSWDVDLRRTLGSWLASGGTSLPIIGKGPQEPGRHQGLRAFDARPVRYAMQEATAAMRKAGELRPSALPCLKFASLETM